MSRVKVNAYQSISLDLKWDYMLPSNNYSGYINDKKWTVSEKIFLRVTLMKNDDCMWYMFNEHISHTIVIFQVYNFFQVLSLKMFLNKYVYT